MNTIDRRIYEAYSVMINTNDSILKINPIINKFGYEFAAFDIRELELKFSNLFYLPANFQSESVVFLEDDETGISGEFYDIITNSKEFGINVILTRQLILLKRIEDYKLEIINHSMDVSQLTTVGRELREFTQTLIQQLWLYKNGGINCPTQFLIDKDTRKIVTRLNKNAGNHSVADLYLINDDDISKLNALLKDSFIINPLTELAITLYNVSYRLPDIRTRYISLMTALESLFNHGKDQIAHTISRHMAAIISKDKNEFMINYKEMKKLYKLRNDIVHGSVPKGDLKKATDELQDKARQAINYCLQLSMDKNALFDRLNCMGFVD